MELVLPDPRAAEPGGFTRESLLASVAKQIAGDDDSYELRMILGFDVPVDCPHDVTEGEMLFMVAYATGGPLAKLKANSIIAEADAICRSGEAPDTLAPYLLGGTLDAKRVLVIPPPCFSQMSDAPDSHPLHGVAYVSAKDLRFKLADAPSELAHFAKLVDFCVRTKVVLSVQRD